MMTEMEKTNPGCEGFATVKCSDLEEEKLRQSWKVKFAPIAREAAEKAQRLAEAKKKKEQHENDLATWKTKIATIAKEVAEKFQRMAEAEAARFSLPTFSLISQKSEAAEEELKDLCPKPVLHSVCPQGLFYCTQGKAHRGCFTKEKMMSEMEKTNPGCEDFATVKCSDLEEEKLRQPWKVKFAPIAREAAEKAQRLAEAKKKKAQHENDLATWKAKTATIAKEVAEKFQRMAEAKAAAREATESSALFCDFLSSLFKDNLLKLRPHKSHSALGSDSLSLSPPHRFLGCELFL